MRRNRDIAIGVAAALAAGLVQAQTASPQATIKEITVLARRRAEDLQQVPLAVTAITAEQIARSGIRDVVDAVRYDTSASFYQNFSPRDTRIVIRGLSPTRGRPNVASLVDGIDISSEAVGTAGGSLLINPRLLDVERIEIIKGPQSALYGRSAFAGAVQYITRNPGEDFIGEAFIDVAEYGR
jgi:outer membrane receptor protein involved in Fe transport